MSILDQVNLPVDLKKLTIKELNLLAEDIREFILNTISQNGGHLASNLGVVELTIAMHYVFDTPKDKMIWDVSHQSYTHKILTGRKDEFKTLRQMNGLSGFTKINESEHDAFGAGHSSTSISAVLGLAVARDLKKEDHEVIAVIGDGSMTGGMAFEALNNLGNLNTDATIILNDNKMSISPNVGALSAHLNKLSMVKIRGKERGDIGTIFENLNFYYIPPIDGHNIESLIENLEMAKSLHGPLLVHVNTIKGKGYRIAEDNSGKYHGVAAFDRESGKVIKTGSEQKKFSNIFGDKLVEMAKKDDKIIAITAAMPAGTGLDKFASQFPDRFFDVGIAEQHAITFAAGLAKEGFKPYVAIYSTFAQRAYDQIIHDVALQNLPVRIMLDRAGLVGDDGPTHHGVFDLAFLRPIPNITITAPKDENEFDALLELSAKHDQGPFVIRYPRGASPEPRYETVEEIKIGQNEILKKGDDLTIIAIGTMVYTALEVAEMLEKENIHATVINARFLKPFDEKIVLDNMKSKKIITIEEGVLKGGLGSEINELINRGGLSGIQVMNMGIPDYFVEHGNNQQLFKQVNLSSEHIIKQCRKFSKNK